MNDDADYETTDAMIRYGGSFAAGLGRLFRAADPMNQTRLKIAFSDYFAQYHKAATRAKYAATARAETGIDALKHWDVS